MAPPEKRQKTGAEAPGSATPAPKREDQKKVDAEVGGEVEKDATAPKKSYNGEVTFRVQDTTMNVLSSGATNILKTLSEGAVQSLLAGARASVGMQSGRYVFEVQILEKAQGAKKPVLKLGFASEDSSLLLGDDETNICFDIDGAFVHNKVRSQIETPNVIVGETTFAVVLNLDSKSANSNTISLFKDGVRVCPPQALPNSLKGKTLFPAVTFRMMTLHVNFGPEPLHDLPFVCRMLQGGETSELVPKAAVEEPKDGKYEVMYPVGLPGEGVFDWLDAFLLKNPQYRELSDRSVVEWAEKSGIQQNRTGSAKASNDKPDMREMDGVLRALTSAAAVQPRNFVVMELQKNLLVDERAKLLQLFPKALFKQVANVVVNEPTADFLQMTQAHTLKAKQEAANVAHKVQVAIEKKKWHAEKLRKEAEVNKRKAEVARAKALKEAQKKIAEEKRKKENAAKVARGEPVEEVEEPKEVEEPEEIFEDVVMGPEPEEGPAPKVKLTEEEKAIKFRTSTVPDLSSLELSRSFAKFSIPIKEEGFDSIAYLWSKEKEAKAYMKKWIFDRKINTRLEDLRPSAWFEAQHLKWQKSFTEWFSKLTAVNAAQAKREQEKKAKVTKKLAAAAKARVMQQQKEVEKKRKEVERARKIAAGEKVEEEKEEEPVSMEVEEEHEAEDSAEPAAPEVTDVFDVEDVCDVGGGHPLFKDFLAEDWALLALRFELHLLCHAFRRDAGDEDRTGVFLDHLGFYYNLYFKKTLSPNAFGVESMQELVALVDDTVRLTRKQVIESKVPDELEVFGIFVKITEEARRERHVRLEMGDESVRLKIAGTSQAKPAVNQEVLEVASPNNPNLQIIPGGQGIQIGGDKRKWVAGGGGGGKGWVGAWGGKGKW